MLAEFLPGHFPLPPKERRTFFADADEGENEKELRSMPFASSSSGDGGSPLLGGEGKFRA